MGAGRDRARPAGAGARPPRPRGLRGAAGPAVAAAAAGASRSRRGAGPAWRTCASSMRWPATPASWSASGRSPSRTRPTHRIAAWPPGSPISTRRRTHTHASVVIASPDGGVHRHNAAIAAAAMRAIAGAVRRRPGQLPLRRGGAGAGDDAVLPRRLSPRRAGDLGRARVGAPGPRRRARGAARRRRRAPADRAPRTGADGRRARPRRHRPRRARPLRRHRHLAGAARIGEHRGGDRDAVGERVRRRRHARRVRDADGGDQGAAGPRLRLLRPDAAGAGGRRPRRARVGGTLRRPRAAAVFERLRHRPRRRADPRRHARGLDRASAARCRRAVHASRQAALGAPAPRPRPGAGRDDDVREPLPRQRHAC